MFWSYTVVGLLLGLMLFIFDFGVLTGCNIISYFSMVDSLVELYRLLYYLIFPVEPF